MELAPASVPVGAARVACPAAAVRALAASAPVAVEGRDLPDNLAAVFGKAAEAPGTPAADWALVTLREGQAVVREAVRAQGEALELAAVLVAGAESGSGEEAAALGLALVALAPVVAVELVAAALGVEQESELGEAQEPELGVAAKHLESG